MKGQGNPFHTRNHQTESWKNLDNVDEDDYYFSRFMTRIRKQFYIEIQRV